MTLVVLGARAAAPPAAGDICLGVAGHKLVVATDADGRWRFTRVGDLGGATDLIPLGSLDGIPVWTTAISSTVDAPPTAISSTVDVPHEMHGWASMAARLPQPLAALAGRALQVMTWRRTHRFCGSCAAELADVDGEHARRCPSCDLFVPMRLSPAVLVLVRRAGTGELLLVRHTYGAIGIWALVAGFVEAGESLEETVAREVAEEVGLRVAEVRYFGSQPWALSGPGILLTGFTALCADRAEPVVDGRELAEAGWFDPGALPTPLPPAYSLSRWLIDAHSAAGSPG